MRSLIALLTACIIVVSVAQSRDLGQWGETSETSRWYSTLMQPDHPATSCCGEADAYWCDDVSVSGDVVSCAITDDRPDEPLRRRHVDVGTKIVIPPHKLKWDRGNPTGHAIVFLNLSSEVYCFVQNGGV